MKIENCTSLFELSCAFNFAFAALHKSNNSLSRMFDVVKWINELFLSTTKIIKEDIEGIELLVEGTNNDKRTLYKTTLEDFRETFGHFEKKEDSYNNYDSNFSLISLFMGFFCISVLFLSASETNTKYISLFVLILLYLSLILTLLLTNKYINIDIRMKYLLTIIFSCLLSILGFKFHYWGKECPYIIGHEEITYLIIFSFLFSFGHFIFYFILVSFHIFYLYFQIAKFKLKRFIYKGKYGKI